MTLVSSQVTTPALQRVAEVLARVDVELHKLPEGGFLLGHQTKHVTVKISEREMLDALRQGTDVALQQFLDRVYDAEIAAGTEQEPR